MHLSTSLKQVCATPMLEGWNLPKQMNLIWRAAACEGVAIVPFAHLLALALTFG